MYPLLLILMSMFVFDVHASISRAAICTVLPNLKHTRIPKRFSLSSSMDHLAGSWKYAQGSKIRLIGKILDDNCMPLKGATIQIWQKDAKGTDIADHTKALVNDDFYDKDGFSHTGSAIAESDGSYNFFTIAPKDGIINFIATYRKYPLFSGQIYLNKSAFITAQKKGAIKSLHKKLQELFQAYDNAQYDDRDYNMRHFNISLGMKK